MPKYYDAFEVKYFREKKENEWFWSNLLSPDYKGSVKTKDEFDKQLQEGNRNVVREEKQDIIPTYMYHHDLKYSSLLLKFKENKFEVYIVSILAVFLLFNIFMIIKAINTGTIENTSTRQLSAIDIATGVIMTMGLVFGGINIAIKGFTPIKLVTMLTAFVGSVIIFYRAEIANTIYPYVKEYPYLLFICALSLFCVLYLNIYSKKSYKSK
ncbi:hypothetical protein [Bacillus sp. AFS040349]|uniref:hypothetical protein n=1 Tax=Bacillus sp. AFS040349 TaxID=2033502 RepID=UPI000BFC82B7|nr:hypothetical protein [Bacillus sp. AFS040349]PGT80559.1 hypothetical protein COD11_20835 [Bacillus sp. AFS040349]